MKLSFINNSNILLKPYFTSERIQFTAFLNIFDILKSRQLLGYCTNTNIGFIVAKERDESTLWKMVNGKWYNLFFELEIRH